MKKFTGFLLVIAILALAAAAAMADGAQDAVVQMAKGLLTEVYGYTQDEADAFTYDVTDGGDIWTVRFYQNPGWVYKVGIKKVDMSFAGALTPFTTLYPVKAPENSVRDALRAMEANGWLKNWNAQSKAALYEQLARYGDIHIISALQIGLTADGYTPAQALQDFFLSCYGDSALWSREVTEWRDAAFNAFGLVRETAANAVREGIVEYVIDKTETYSGTMICEFAGEVPAALAEAFSNPNLEGWECLAGAYQALNKPTGSDSPTGTGLAAFAKGEERLLVMLWQDSSTLAWRVLPISDKALFKGRELTIVYGENTSQFDIVYPLSDTQTETFRCRLAYDSTLPAVPLRCMLLEYRYTDLGNGTQMVIDPGDDYSYAGWYRMVKTENGVAQETEYAALFSGYMEYLKAETFPRTEEECSAAAEATAYVPDGYGFSSGVHLRQKATSHSGDLGTYRIGTLLEVLGTEPGVDFPWYHVRIGVAEGYISGNYVLYSDSALQISRNAVLCVGRLKADTALKQGTGMFDGSVAQLPAGTVVRVLAERGNWLHVSVPGSEDDWMMQPGEVNGYVKSDAVLQAVTALQFDWLDD